MSTQRPPAPAPKKGILKRPSARSNSTKTKDMVSKLNAADPQPQEPDPQEQSLLEQAVKQAEILQRLKESGDIKEPVALEVFERLSQFPLTRTAAPSYGTADNPAPADAREFIAAVETFLPSEYDDLIEERNILGRCGYALCPRPRRDFAGEWKIRPTGIARVEDLNKWCSEKCAVRALHVRVQLDNPTYMRRRSAHGNGKVVTVPKIELREEDRPKQSSEEAPEGGREGTCRKQEDAFAQMESKFLSSLRLHTADEEPEDLSSRNSTLLAAERLGGSHTGHSAAAQATATLNQHLQTLPLLNNGRQQQHNSIEVTIRERETLAPARPPGQPKAGNRDGGEEAHLMVEGYKIGAKFGLLRDKDKSATGNTAARSNPRTTHRNTAQDAEDSDGSINDDDDDFLPTLRF